MAPGSTGALSLAAAAEAEASSGGTILALIAGVVLLVANGFFVAIEFALVASGRSGLQVEAEKGTRGARLALAAASDLNRQVAAAQIGITFASLGLGYLAEPALAGLFEDTFLSGVGEGARHSIGAGIALAIVVFLHILLGEMVPKNLALANATRLAIVLAPVHKVFVRLFNPLLWFLNSLSERLLGLMGVASVDEKGEARTPAELANLIKESRGEGVLDDFESSLLSGALDLGEREAASVMVPWTEVATVRRSATVAEIEATVVDTGHSRLPVVADDATDSVIGWVHSKDLFQLDAAEWDRQLPDNLVRPQLKLGQHQTLEEVLVRMQGLRRHFGIVVDGNGGTAGIMTLEDILELVVGDINDETDMSATNATAEREARL